MQIKQLDLPLLSNMIAIKQLLLAAETILAAANIENSKLDTQLLLSEVLQISRAELLLQSELSAEQAAVFNEYIKQDYKDIKNEVVDEGSVTEAQKQIVAQLLSDAKSNAFIEIQKSTGFDDDGYLKQLAKEKAKVQEAISKKKKYYKK